MPPPPAVLSSLLPNQVRWSLREGTLAGGMGVDAASGAPLVISFLRQGASIVPAALTLKYVGRKV